MLKVRALGASMLRGNGTNFYIRCDDDLDDQGTDDNRGAEEYPHIHVATDGPKSSDNIVYIGITYGGGGQNIDIYRNGAHQMDIKTAMTYIQAQCPRISAERVHPLAQYLFGYHVQVAHQ